MIIFLHSSREKSFYLLRHLFLMCIEMQSSDAGLEQDCVDSNYRLSMTLSFFMDFFRIWKIEWGIERWDYLGLSSFCSIRTSRSWFGRKASVSARVFRPSRSVAFVLLEYVFSCLSFFEIKMYLPLFLILPLSGFGRFSFSSFVQSSCNISLTENLLGICWHGRILRRTIQFKGSPLHIDRPFLFVFSEHIRCSGLPERNVHWASSGGASFWFGLLPLRTNLIKNAIPKSNDIRWMVNLSFLDPGLCTNLNGFIVRSWKNLVTLIQRETSEPVLNFRELCCDGGEGWNLLFKGTGDEPSRDGKHDGWITEYQSKDNSRKYAFTRDIQIEMW